MRSGYRRLSSSLCLAAVLGGAALMGCATRSHHRYDRGREDGRRYDRVRDRHHGDYHAWNDGEDRAYRHYLAERRREYRDFFRLSGREQRAYWSWRHGHLDIDFGR